MQDSKDEEGNTSAVVTTMAPALVISSSGDGSNSRQRFEFPTTFQLQPRFFSPRYLYLVSGADVIRPAGREEESQIHVFWSWPIWSCHCTNMSGKIGWVVTRLVTDLVWA